MTTPADPAGALVDRLETEASFHGHDGIGSSIRDLLLEAAMALRASGEGQRKAVPHHRLVYNKATKKIDKVRSYDGLAVESFDPPEESQ